MKAPEHASRAALRFTDQLGRVAEAKGRTMHYYLSKRWRLKFRRDPDTGRVLFIGPLVASLDVTRRPGSKTLRMCWTCCDVCHAEHASKLAAWAHWLWLRATRKA